MVESFGRLNHLPEPLFLRWLSLPKPFREDPRKVLENVLEFPYHQGDQGSFMSS